jgi:hypothetical protein
VNRAKDTGQSLWIARVPLERNKILIELIEVLLALNKKLLHELFVAAHDDLWKNSPCHIRITARGTANTHAPLRSDSPGT